MKFPCRLGLDKTEKKQFDVLNRGMWKGCLHEKRESQLTKTMTCSAGAGGCTGRVTASASAAAAPVASLLLPLSAPPPIIQSQWSGRIGDKMQVEASDSDSDSDGEMFAAV
jgi:hypothetical protein